MIFLKPIGKRRPNNDQRNYDRARRIVAYPPASTGTNYNLVEKVEHDPNEKVIWKIIHSPDGDFVSDYELKSNRRKRRKRCVGCENFLELGQRKCLKCQAETRTARNRRHYQVLKTRFKTGSP
jgi:hypothetical protein